MTDPTKDRDQLAEAQRLALVPVEDQKQILAMHRAIAGNAKVPKADRQLARERADALEKHLRLLNKSKKKQ